MKKTKSTKVFWCHTTQKYIMASYCLHNCDYTNYSPYADTPCPQGNLFNSCKLISENNKKDIDKACRQCYNKYIR